MEKQLNTVSFFSGIGAFEKAATNLGIKLNILMYCEIDKWASTSYSAIHGVSEDLNKGDILEVNTEEVPDCDLITHGSPCFKKGTLITTSEGMKRIEEIKKGDMVLTHKNRFREVVKPMINYANDIYNVKIQGSPITFVTEEHPYYVRRMQRVWNKETKKNERTFSEPIWVEVKDLKKGDFIGMGLNTNSKNPKKLTKEQCWLIGRYVADGYIRNAKRANRKNSYNNQVIFCVGKDKIEDFKEGLKEYRIGISEERTAYKCRIINKEFMDLCMECGRGAENKKIPQFIMDLPVDLLKEFLDGYISGDGSFDNTSYKANSVSKKLIYQLGQVVNKVYNVPYSIYYTKRPKTTVIEGRTVNQRDTWSITFRDEIEKQNHAVVIDGMLWTPFRKKELISFNDKVYNFEVADDNSYVANNCTVHNCQDFSIAGKGQGGNKGSETRSSLMWTTVNIIEHKMPKYVIWENVKGILSKNHKHNFDKYIEKLSDMGYTNYYDVLNAKNYGIPQNRDRIYVISIRNDIDDKNFLFPEAFDTGLRLKHLLEDSVHEKYYIKEERYETLLKEIREKEFEIQKEIQDNRILQINNPNHFSQRVYLNEGISPTIAAGNNGGGQEPCKILEISDIEARACLTPDRENIRQNGRRFKNNGEPMFTITATDRHGVIINKCQHLVTLPKSMLNDNERQRRIYSINGISPSILSRSDSAKILQIGMLDMKGSEQIRRVYNPEGIAPTLDTMQGGHREPKIICNENELVFVGGITDKDWAGDGKRLSRNFSQGDRVYSVNGIACTQTSQGGGVGSYTGLYLEPNDIQMVEMEQIVRVREFNVNIEDLIQCLRESKDKSKLTIRQIAEKTNRPITSVEHWFRRDSSFSIPDEDVWHKLKRVLGIETNEFDLSITSFIEKEGVYEKSNRYFYENGISPTLTTVGGEKIIQKQTVPNYAHLYFRKDIPNISIHSSIKPSVAKNFEREKQDIFMSTKDIYQCQCDSGWQDNKVGLKISPTLRAGNNHTSVLDNKYRIRKLTPLECWRLMGFSDEDYWVARRALETKYYNGGDRSNSQMYKQAGNSIVVNVLEEIYKNLFKDYMI